MFRIASFKRSRIVVIQKVDIFHTYQKIAGSKRPMAEYNYGKLALQMFFTQTQKLDLTIDVCHDDYYTTSSHSCNLGSEASYITIRYTSFVSTQRVVYADKSVG